MLYERSQEAMLDWQEIVEYTFDQYGVEQTLNYTNKLLGCIESMAKGSGYFKEIEVKGRTVRVKHCQKHYIFGWVRADKPLLVIALFHEHMDLMSRLA
ncbi:MAG: type II toxin-antitoxin system RelE/ParE family toxin [Cyclobacteriaceae bacterium]|nr:type II toxin-antitoxin system RelE/ParE family toxin [Cyclobacteriaceae bacterium]